MRKIGLLAVTAIIMSGIAFTSCNSQSVSPARMKTEADSVSFTLGKVQGYQMKKQTEVVPAEINEDFLAGFVAGWNNPEDTLFMGKTLNDAYEYFNAYFMRGQNEENLKTKEEGEKFLKENSTKSGVLSTPSGLQYKVITEGTGIKPNETDTVRVHYTGKLLDETVFQTSVGNEPIKWPVNQFIRGWSEGLQLMQTGSKYIFWIPSELAYGEPGNQNIKPNSTLIFEVELIEVIREKK